MTKHYLIDADPGLQVQWNTERNGPIPVKITINSHKKVWWRCEYGHEWEAVIGNRTRGVSNCPYCSNRKVGYGNDLASTHPDLIKELHPAKNIVDPSTITYGSKTKLWWLCSNGHSFQATAQLRLRGRGCPYCLNRKLGQGNDLQTQYPELALEWIIEKNGFPPSEQISGGIKFNAWWKCFTCGHEWQRDVKGRVDGAGCPICSQQYAIENRINNHVKRVGSFAEHYPVLAKEWHQIRNKRSPSEYSRGSDQAVWWLCPRGHSYQMSIKNRTKKRGYGCPKCSGNTSKIEIRTLSELEAIFGELRWRHKIKRFEADIWSEQFGFVVEVDGYPWHREKEKRDRKKNAHFESLGLTVFRLRDSRLPAITSNDISLNQGIPSDENDLEGIKRLVSTITDNVANLPKKILQDSEQYLKLDRFKAETGFQKYLKHYRGPSPGRSLKVLYPEIAKEWSDRNLLKPEQVSAHSNEKFWFVCPKGHDYEQAIGSRTDMKTNCPICANRRVLKGYNDLESNFPRIAKEWSPNNKMTPSEVVYRSKKKALWMCPVCGKEYESAIRNRALYNTACASCSKKKVWSMRKYSAIVEA